MQWEYKTVIMNRSGTHEDFSSKWTYSPWELYGVGSAGSLSLAPGLQEMGRDGWELVSALPTDVWVEGNKSPGASHGHRTISYTLLFKRALADYA